MVASVAVSRAMDRDIQRQAGLALAEHHLLAVIDEAGEAGIRPTDLALASTLTKSGLTRAVDRLESTLRRLPAPSPRKKRSRRMAGRIKARSRV